MNQGMSNSTTCKIVGVNRKTGNRWRHGRTYTDKAGRSDGIQCGTAEIVQSASAMPGRIGPAVTPTSPARRLQSCAAIRALLAFRSDRHLHTRDRRTTSNVTQSRKEPTCPCAWQQSASVRAKRADPRRSLWLGTARKPDLVARWLHQPRAHAGRLRDHGL